MLFILFVKFGDLFLPATSTRESRPATFRHTHFALEKQFTSWQWIRARALRHSTKFKMATKTAQICETNQRNVKNLAESASTCSVAALRNW